MRRVVCLLVLGLCAVPARAHAEGEDSPGFEYLVNDGALPFFWGSAAVTLGLHFFAEPPEEPLFFSDLDGGETNSGDTIPEIAVAAYAVAGGGVVALVPNQARWQHLKGYASSVATTLALTEVAKNVFGRQRPHFDPETSESIDDRRSFFSGHASVTAASTLYLGMYMRRHLFAEARGESELPWWEGGTYLALGAIYFGVPVSRVIDKRHHKTDVIAGTLVGTATSFAFFAYHEGLWKERRELRATRPMLLPDIENRGLVLMGTF